MLTCFSGQHAVRGWASQAVHLALRAQHREAARLDQLLHNRYIRITYPTTLMPRQNCLVVSAWKSNFQVLKPPSPFLSLFLWYQAETHFGANSQKKCANISTCRLRMVRLSMFMQQVFLWLRIWAHLGAAATLVRFVSMKSNNNNNKSWLLTLLTSCFLFKVFESRKLY